MVLSEGERSFLIDGIAADLRCDGRGRGDYRSITLEAGIMPQTNGSARIKIGGTDVLVGVKMEVGEPKATAPDQGYVQAAVECCPSGAPEIERRGSEALHVECALALEQSIAQASTIDWRQLCHVPGRSCWVVHVDALVVQCDGGLLDAISIGAFAALHNTRIPHVDVSTNENGDVELEVNDDPTAYSRLDTTGMPLCITLYQVGGRHVVDPSLEEEACTTARMTIAVDTNGGNICGMHKGGQGGLDPSSLYEMIQSAQVIGASLRAKLDKYLAQEDPDTDLATFATKIGFFAR